MFLNHNKPWKLRKDLVSYLRRRKLLDPCRKIFWPVPICTPRAEPENHEHAPCWTNETRASQTINTVRVDQHAPCKTGNQRTCLANTPRAGDPCGAKQRTRPVQLTRAEPTLSRTVRAADPCAEEVTHTPHLHGPCAGPVLLPFICFLKLFSLTVSGFHPELKCTSPKPNHYHNTSILPSIHSCKLIKP